MIKKLICCVLYTPIRFKKSAFTLAEVLITLGIIGVVAAMTIPNLMTNIRHRDTTSKLKKFYSVMRQLTLSAEEEFGPVSEWDTSLPYREFITTYFAPFMKFTFDEGASSSGRAVILHDGSSMTIAKGRCMDITFDTNGKSLPNNMGYDKFNFLLCDKSISEWCAEEGFCTYRKSDVKKRNNRQEYLSLCKNTSPSYCSALIEYDNWKIESDYPYK